jgi:hypothetical protein
MKDDDVRSNKDAENESPPTWLFVVLMVAIFTAIYTAAFLGWIEPGT